MESLSEAQPLVSQEDKLSENQKMPQPKFQVKSQRCISCISSALEH